MSSEKFFKSLVRVATILAFIVITLGAYVRLSDAGLGCPDWPGCYGKAIVPAAEQMEQTNAAYPERPLEIGKAWKEMVHRYAAGSLGLIVFWIMLLAWKRRRIENQPIVIPAILSVLIIFQALLGMWTVTLMLKPVIVMAHLLGGMTILLLLVFLCLRTSRINLKYRNNYKNSRLLPYALMAMVVVYMQIFLGGWTSANYAALVCPDFPTCRGEWLPPMNIKDGFTFWTGLGKNYEFGLLDVNARTAIHFFHRVGAVITFFVVVLVAIRALLSRQMRVRLIGVLAGITVCFQALLGVLNVKLVLPIQIAVAHNGVAALLLCVLGTLLYFSGPKYFNRSRSLG